MFVDLLSPRHSSWLCYWKFTQGPPICYPITKDQTFEDQRLMHLYPLEVSQFAPENIPGPKKRAHSLPTIHFSGENSSVQLRVVPFSALKTSSKIPKILGTEASHYTCRLRWWTTGMYWCSNTTRGTLYLWYLGTANQKKNTAFGSS